MAITGKGKNELIGWGFKTKRGSRSVVNFLTTRSIFGDTDAAAGIMWRDWFFDAVSVSATISGTITAGVNESDIVTGGKTLIITITGDTWVTSGANFDGQRDEIIAGVDSAQAEATGWDAVPKATQGLSGVVRTSDTVATITWDAFATYDITAQETITVTVPGTALIGGNAVVATPSFTVNPSGGLVNNQRFMLFGVG